MRILLIVGLLLSAAFNCFFTVSVSNATECCITRSETYVELGSGPGWTLQVCPNGDEMECYLRHRTYSRTLCCFPNCDLQTEVTYCRPDCDDTPVDMIAMGYSTYVTTEWEEWDMTDPPRFRNPHIGCYPMTCFCQEDICAGIARKETDFGNCTGTPCP
jgi:hypothetical protein